MIWPVMNHFFTSDLLLDEIEPQTRVLLRRTLRSLLSVARSRNFMA